MFFCMDLLDLMQTGTLEPEAAFINASFIPDIFPVLSAAHKTVIAKSRESLTTRTLNSELVYNFSGSTNFYKSEFLKRCGISDSTNYSLVVRFGASADEMTTIKGLVKGVLKLTWRNWKHGLTKLKFKSATKPRSKSLEYLLLQMP